MSEKWIYRVNNLEAGKVIEFSLFTEDSPMSFNEFLEKLNDSGEFRKYYNSILAACPFEAFRWENRSITKNTKSRDYTFVVVDSPSLERRLDKSSFSDYLSPTDDVASFPSLGRDATMIIPTEPKEGDGYGHLAKFVRSAPEHVVDKFWKVVATETLMRVGDSPIWLSTAGGGVSWLHARIDSRPKYYSFRPYKI